MLGSSILSSRTSSDSRVFIYEVTGLRQNDQTANNGHEIRHSDSQFVQVPFSRMSEFMQRVDRLGGRIVNIRTSHGAAEHHEGEHKNPEASGKKKKG